MERHLETIMGSRGSGPKKLRVESESALYTLEMLRSKVMANQTKEEDSDDDVTATNKPTKGPIPGQEVLELSDDDE